MFVSYFINNFKKIAYDKQVLSLAIRKRGITPRYLNRVRKERIRKQTIPPNK